MKYLDCIDLTAEVALGRLSAAAKHGPAELGATMATLLTEAYNAGNENVDKMLAALREDRDALRRAYNVIGDLEDTPTQETTDCLSQIRAAGENTVALLAKVDT